MSLLDNYDGYAVTVVTVCRNAGDKLDVTAASIAAQGRPDCEWLVVDGASTDNTVRRAEAWRERMAGSVRIVSEPDAGIYDAMNKGLRRARGEWVLFLNAGDELIDAEALKSWVAKARDDVGLITGVTRMRDPLDGFTVEAGGEFSWVGVGVGKVPPHPSCLYRRDAAVAAGGYPEAFGLAGDTVLTLRVAASGGVAHVPRVTALFSMDGVSSRFDWRWRVHRDKARAIREAAPDWVWRRYRWRWPLEALRATAAHLLRCCGLLGLWRRIKRVAGGRDDDRRGDR